MADVRGRTFGRDEPVETDGTTFVDCIFEGSQLRYNGGPHPSFQACDFRQISWLFGDAALRTIQLLQALNGQEGSREMVTEMFKPGAFIGG